MFLAPAFFSETVGNTMEDCISVLVSDNKENKLLYLR